jgi:tRNA pseudouridine55 synthase
LEIPNTALKIFNGSEQITKELVESGLIFLINKPLHWTSFDVVNKLRFALRHQFGIKKLKVGHAGTLDPLATGLMIICCGKYTKMIENFSGLSKTYTAQIKLGATTATYDAEAQEENIKLVDLTSIQIEQALDHFKGEIDQVPPIFSAIKVNGKSAYTLARRGKDVELKSRRIAIHKIKLINLKLPHLEVFCDVSKGTYIRSIAHDLGQLLGFGGYLTALVRNSIGTFHLNQGFDLDELLDHIRQ